MAYAFDRINRVLEEKEDKENKENNYLNSSIGTESSNPVGSLAPPSAPTNTNESFNKFTPSAASEAKFNAFKGKSTVPGFIGTLEGDINKRKDDVKKDITNWVSEQRKKINDELDVNKKNVDRAIDPTIDAPEYGKIKDLYNKIIDPKGYVSKPVLPSPSVIDVKDINTFPKIQDLFRKNQGPRYTPGMSEFDTNLLKSTPQFNKRINDLVSQQNELKKIYDDTYDKLVPELNSEALQRLGKSKEYIKNYLQQHEDKLKEDQEAQAYELNRQLNEIKNKSGPLYETRLKEIKDKIYQGLLSNGVQLPKEVADRWLAEFSQQDLVNALIIPKDKPEFLPKDLYSNLEAKKFNKINALLGDSESVLANEINDKIQMINQIEIDPTIDGKTREQHVRRLMAEIDDLKNKRNQFFNNLNDDQQLSKEIQKYLDDPNNKDIKEFSKKSYKKSLVDNIQDIDQQVKNYLYQYAFNLNLPDPQRGEINYDFLNTNIDKFPELKDKIINKSLTKNDVTNYINKINSQDYLQKSLDKKSMAAILPMYAYKNLSNAIKSNKNAYSTSEKQKLDLYRKYFGENSGVEPMAESSNLFEGSNREALLSYLKNLIR